MSDKFESEVAALLEARDKKKQTADAQRLQRQADVEQFVDEWTRLRNDVVAPTLEQIALALEKMGVVAKVEGYGANALALRMALGDSRVAAGAALSGQPCLTFMPTPHNKTVTVTDEIQPIDKKLNEITPDYIERAVLSMAKRILGS